MSCFTFIKKPTMQATKTSIQNLLSQISENVNHGVNLQDNIKSYMLKNHSRREAYIKQTIENLYSQSLEFPNDFNLKFFNNIIDTQKSFQEIKDELNNLLRVVEEHELFYTSMAYRQCLKLNLKINYNARSNYIITQKRPNLEVLVLNFKTFV